MTALWILLGILAFFVFLFNIPIHVILKADDDVAVTARVLFVKYSLFPMKKRPKKKKKTVKNKKKSTEPKKKPQKQEPKPKKKRDILGLVKLLSKLAFAVLRKFPRHFRVRVLRYEISIATGDAAKTAMLYGAVTSASAHLFELLRHATRFRIGRKAPVNVYADFLGEKPKFAAELDISVTLWGACHMLMAAGMAFVKAKFSAKNKQTPEKKPPKTEKTTKNN